MPPMKILSMTSIGKALLRMEAVWRLEVACVETKVGTVGMFT